MLKVDLGKGVGHGSGHPYRGPRRARRGRGIGQPTPATLCFDNGLEHLSLRAGVESSVLLSAVFADPPPVVWAIGADVHVEYPSAAAFPAGRAPVPSCSGGHRLGRCRCTAAPPELDADLRGTSLRAVTLAGAVAHSTLRLPPPPWPCLIRIGAVKDVIITHPPHQRVRLEIARTATNVRFGRRRPQPAPAMGLIDQTHGWDPEAPGYLVLVSGGVDGLTIETERP